MAEGRGDTLPLRLTVVFSPAPRRVEQREFTLAAPCTVTRAIEESGLMGQFPELMAGLADGSLVTGVWGRKASASQRLQDNDRVEIYRPLAVDPKLARRLRFKGQGVRAAGLFAKRRPGAKPGY